MLQRLRDLSPIYLSKRWAPSGVTGAVIIVNTLLAGVLMKPGGIIVNGMLSLLIVALVGMLCSAIFHLVKKRWSDGLINLGMLPVCLVAGIAVPVLTMLLVNTMFGGTWLRLDVPLPEANAILSYRWDVDGSSRRRVQITSGGKTFQEHPLVAQLHFAKFVNIYLHEFGDAQWLRLKDDFGEYVFNLKTGEGNFLGHDKKVRVPVRGPLSDGDIKNRGMPVVPGQRSEIVYDRRFLDEGRYLGRLTYENYPPFKFVPASQKPEQRIGTAYEYFE